MPLLSIISKSQWIPFPAVTLSRRIAISNAMLCYMLPWGAQSSLILRSESETFPSFTVQKVVLKRDQIWIVHLLRLSSRKGILAPEFDPNMAKLFVLMEILRIFYEMLESIRPEKRVEMNVLNTQRSKIGKVLNFQSYPVRNRGWDGYIRGRSDKS